MSDPLNCGGNPENRSEDRPLQKKERGVEEDKTKSEDEEPTLAQTARVGHPKPSQRVKAAPPAFRGASRPGLKPRVYRAQ
jgi:hypothetical protein